MDYSDNAEARIAGMYPEGDDAQLVIATRELSSQYLQFWSRRMLLMGTEKSEMLDTIIMRFVFRKGHF